MAAGLTLVALVLLTVGAAIATRVVVRQQERRLLIERTREVRLVLTTAISTRQSQLVGLGAVLQSDGGSKAGFVRASAVEAAAGAGSSTVTFAVLRPSPTGVQVDAVAGAALTTGTDLTGPAAEVGRDAGRAPGMVATPILGSGAQRSIGFALGPPSAPPGTVLYEQLRLGPVSAPRQASTAAFDEVSVVLYAAPTAASPQVLVATSPDLPLRGSVDYVPMPVGASHWLLGVSPTRPLVGTVAARAPWFVLAVGLIGSVLIALIIWSEARRRVAALGLYESEHHLAESLQRSLLPALPELGGLEMAARYLAGGASQQVGGDWFDAFPLDGGRVGVVIGDVMGHDIQAAAAMSQIRAALRAFAWLGTSPAAVLDRLEAHIDAFGFTDLVTVFFGVLEAPGADGGRPFRFANAGHLPPLLRLPGGQTDPLGEGRSVLIGAPRSQARSDGTLALAAGSTLLFYTDGLIEVPGTSLQESLDQLGATVTGDGAPEQAEALCERVLATMLPRPSHDDVAMLVIRLVETRSPAPTGEEGVPGAQAGTTGPTERRPKWAGTRLETDVAVVLLLLVLVLILAGAGFVIHLLWVAAAVIFVVWAVGWLISAAEGDGRRRWYRRY